MRDESPARPAVDREVQDAVGVQRAADFVHRAGDIPAVVDAVLDDREVVAPGLDRERLGHPVAIVDGGVAQRIERGIAAVVRLEWIDRDALARWKEPGDADRATADLDDAGLPGREGVESESLQPAHQLFRAPAVPVHLGHRAGRDARRDRAPVFTFIALGALPTVGAYHCDLLLHVQAMPG